MSDEIRFIAKPGLTDISEAELIGEVWSFDCHVYEIRAQIGDLTVNFTVPEDRVSRIYDDEQEHPATVDGGWSPSNGERVKVKLR